MHQLKLTPLKDKFLCAEFAAYEADLAQALPLLRSLFTTWPLNLSPKEAEEHFRWLISVATQYRGQGRSWAELFTASYEATAAHLARCAARGQDPDRFLVWVMRQGVFE